MTFSNSSTLQLREYFERFLSELTFKDGVSKLDSALEIADELIDTLDPQTQLTATNMLRTYIGKFLDICEEVYREPNPELDHLNNILLAVDLLRDYEHLLNEKLILKRTYVDIKITNRITSLGIGWRVEDISEVFTNLSEEEQNEFLSLLSRSDLNTRPFRLAKEKHSHVLKGA